MKASTSLKMAVLAGVVCALVALPAFAFADPKPEVISPAALAAMQHLSTQYQPMAPKDHLAIDPDVLGIIGSMGATATEAPVIGDGGGEEVVDNPDLGGPVSDDGDDGRVERQTNETTPSIPATTPTVPRRPYLPYTGGDSMGWILAGVAAVALGVAIAALGYGAGLRREDVR